MIGLEKTLGLIYLSIKTPISYGLSVRFDFDMMDFDDGN